MKRTTQENYLAALLLTSTLVAIALIGALTRQPVELLASASQNNITLQLQQLDSTGRAILNRKIGKLTYDGNVGVFTNGIYNDTSSHSQTLPTTNVLQFYFKNTHATAVYTVTWTPQGQSSAVVKKVQPGGVIMFWDLSTSATAGITALTLQSDTSGGTFEMFLGG